jgi:hypothetical protein
MQEDTIAGHEQWQSTSNTSKAPRKGRGDLAEPARKKIKAPPCMHPSAAPLVLPLAETLHLSLVSVSPSSRYIRAMLRPSTLSCLCFEDAYLFSPGQSHVRLSHAPIDWLAMGLYQIFRWYPSCNVHTSVAHVNTQGSSVRICRNRLDFNGTPFSTLRWMRSTVLLLGLWT